MKLRSVAIFILMLTAAMGYAQRVTVLNILNDMPVQQVLIYNQSKTTTTTTDINGKADISVFDASDTLCFKHQSFEMECITPNDLKDQDYLLFLETKVVMMKGFEIVTEREEQQPAKHAQHMMAIPASEIKETQPATTADMLQNTGQINVQRSQMGGGSPVIRGFEANKVLLVVDGVRMNNAIYRSGHLQNAITVDPNALQSTEVSFGPASVIYGSDALGGVVHFRTKDPILAAADTNEMHMNSMMRFATATGERTGHVDFNIGLKRWGFFTSLTAAQYGDLAMGRTRPHGYDDWGLVPFYTERVENEDLMVENPSPHIQVGTGYSQVDGIQKIRFKANKHTDMILNLQMSTSSDVPRYDQLTDYQNGELRWAEWYYGPQNRYMAAYELRFNKRTRWFDHGNMVAAVQRIDEDRIKRRFGNDNRFYQQEDVWVYSYNLDMVKQLDTSSFLSYGLEATYNDVQSSAYAENIITLERTPTITRYPDGGSTLTTTAAYLNYKRNLGKHFMVDAGTRFSYTVLSSQFNDTTFVTLPYNGIDIANDAVTGSVGLIWKPDSGWQISAVASTGFRNPNVDDYGKVFEKDGLVTVPNNELLPEYAYNAELGIAKTIHLRKNGKPNKSYLHFHAVGYYTRLKDAIVRRDFSLNGADSLLIEGDMARIVTNTNAAEAEIYGASFDMKARFNAHWEADASISYTVGMDLTDDRPLGHIPPLFGRLGLKWKNDRLSANTFALFNGWKRTADYDVGVDNFEEATADGTPPWYTINAQFSYKVLDYLTAQFGVHNILDHHYKPFASGISAPGRNFILTLRIGI